MPLSRLKARIRPPEIVAAVDLGSNSFHMVVGRVSHGDFQVLDRIKEMVRLAAGLDDEGNLMDASCQRALECLERFGQRLRDMPRGSVRVVGTNTLRNARNPHTFLRAAEGVLGHPIEIVSGVEEARLVYLGVAHSLAEDGSRRLVVDIGGGSTELVIGVRFEPELMESLCLGCVSVSRRYFPKQRYDEASMARAEQAVLQEIEPVQARYRHSGWAQAVGTSGTIQTVQAVIRERGWSDGPITADALEKLRRAVLKAGNAERLRFDSLGNERRPVFAGGVLVLHGLFRALGIDRMSVADGALREGVLYDLLGRIRFEDTRDRTVRALGARYHVDRQQAERVTATALALLEQVAEAWNLDLEAEQWLRWAAQLHEIGLDISHVNYHRHGEYIARNADMAGFSRQDQSIIAALIRNHRRKLSDTRFSDLGPGRALLVRRLTILLRLSVVLHRGRHAGELPAFSLSVSDNEIDLRLPEYWFTAHPLTQADLEEEVRRLAALDVKLHFGAC